MDLGGLWRVAAGTERQRRTFHEFDHDDSDWAAMRVPSHWAQSIGTAPSPFADEESMLYRHRFEGPGETQGHTGLSDPARPELGTGSGLPSETQGHTGLSDPARPELGTGSGLPSETQGHTGLSDPARPELGTGSGFPGETLGGTGLSEAERGDHSGQPFAGEETAAARRWWLRLEGVAQQGDIWLDGKYLAHTDGYFVPYELEITEQIAARSEHLLAIDATCRRFGDPDNRSTLTGALQDPELCGSEDLIIGGVWRPVRLRSSGPVAICHARAVCADVRTGDRNSAGGRGVSNSADGRTGGSNSAGGRGVSNSADGRTGDSNSAGGRTGVSNSADGRTGDSNSADGRTGDSNSAGGRGVSARLVLRAVLDVPGGGTVYLRTRVAGTEHVHSHHAADGENRVEWNVDVADPPLWWPHALGDQPLCDLTMDAIVGGEVHDRRRFRIGFRSVEMRRWVLHVNGERLFLKGANLLPTQQLLGSASPSEVAADVKAARNAGLDMIRPLAHIARPETYEAADELGMLIWQDLPIRGVMSRSVAAEARRQARETVDLLGHHPSIAVWCAHDDPFPRSKRPTATPPAFRRLGPSWNRDVLDRRLARVLSRCDGSRPVVPHTGVPPHLPSLEGTTSQLWFGLHGGRAADLAPTLARVPTMGRFVSAFGTPVAADQPEVVKTIVETLRRLKYRPTGGFLLHALADTGITPGVEVLASPDRGFGVLDRLRRPKPGWQALMDACRPIAVVADPLPASVRGGDRLEAAVHVLNDTRGDAEGMEVRARVIGPGGAVVSEQRWQGSAPADDCVVVGRVDVEVPFRGPGELTVELTLTHPAAPNPTGSRTHR